MKTKGFLFSIEALMSIAIVVVAIAATGSLLTAGEDNGEKSAVELSNIGARAGAFYFNECSRENACAEPTGYLSQSCGKVIYYGNDNNFHNGTICRGYK